RFSVEIVGELVPEVYKNKNVYDCYINYYLSLQDEKALCYASGKIVACSDNHPAKIRTTADSAKLISSNDSSGFTYRGRLRTPDEVACIGYEISQKAHNALKWLISKQGFHCDEQWYIVFENHAKKIISINEGTFDMLFKGHTDEPEYLNSVDIAYTGSEYAAVVKKYIFNSSKEIPSNSNVVIMGLEAATPGRLSITLYQKLDTSAYFDKVQNWHETCCWNLVTKITDKNDKKYEKYINYVGTPSVRDIVTAVCGEKASDKIKKDVFKRVMACIIDAKPIPRDMIFSLSSFASTPYPISEKYSYQKNLQIACALIRKYYNDKNKREVFTVALNTENTSRDYLFGRLLATAQKLEETALYAAGENRETSAERLHKQFAQKPSRTWKVIYENLLPYIQRLKTSGKNYYSTQINNILAQFDENDFTSTASLSPIYLLSYSSQLFEYNNFKKAEILTEKDD
ncbi:MAG: type I-C CRISPR-associated protein Cas8c/Csd1, partial [Oscillospiraceae bacterium]